MIDKVSNAELKEVNHSTVENYRSIKPEGRTTVAESKDYWKSEFQNAAKAAGMESPDKKDMQISDVNSDSKEKKTDKIQDSNEKISIGEVKVAELKALLMEYFQDLRDKSEYSDTISDKLFDVTDLKKLEPEENAEMREAFAANKNKLKREWEEINGRPWPKYDQDVYSGNKIIRRAGDDYDAHHIQPLGLGGKNEVGNITPLHADVHYDRQGVHAADSPYSKLDKKLGGKD